MAPSDPVGQSDLTRKATEDLEPDCVTRTTSGREVTRNNVAVRPHPEALILSLGRSRVTAAACLQPQTACYMACSLAVDRRIYRASEHAAIPRGPLLYHDQSEHGCDVRQHPTSIWKLGLSPSRVHQHDHASCNSPECVQRSY